MLNWMVRIFVALVLFTHVVTSASSWGQEIDPPPQAQAGANESQLAALESQARQLRSEEKFAEAVEVVEKLLDLEREVHGDNSIEVMLSKQWIVETAQLGEDWPTAIKYSKQLHDFYSRILGKDHWKTTDARVAIEFVQQLSKLTPEQRNELAAADRRGMEVAKLHIRGRFAEAAEICRQMVDVKRRILGSQSTEYADHLNNLGYFYHRSGDYKRAEPLYAEALQIRQKVLGEQHPDCALSLNTLASLYDALGDYPRAEKLFLQSLEIRKQAFGEEHRDYATTLNNLAGLYNEMGDHKRAGPLYKKTLEIRKRVLGERDPDYATSLNNMAFHYHTMGDYANAEPFAKEAVKLRKEILGERHPKYATSLENLGGIYSAMGDYDRAEPIYIEALQISKDSLGPQHPEIASSLNNLALLYKRRGHYDRAEPLYLQALQISKQAFGERHPEYAGRLHNLGALYEVMGDFKRAEKLYNEALQIRKEALGVQHPDYATSLNNLSALAFTMGDYAKSGRLLVEAAKITKQALGEKHPSYATSLNNLALFYNKVGDYARAAPLYTEALQIHRETLGERHPAYASSVSNLGAFYFEIGDHDRAAELLGEAIEIRRTVLGDNHIDYATSLSNLAAVHEATGDVGQALSLYKEASAVLKSTLGEQHVDYATSLNNLASAHSAMGDMVQAAPLLIKALEIDRAVLGEQHPSYASSLSNLALLYGVMGEDEQAVRLLKQALEIITAAFGKHHPRYAASLSNLAGQYVWMGEYARAEPLYTEAIQCTLECLDDTAYVLSEQQQMLMNQDVRHRLDGYLRCCLAGDLPAGNAVAQAVAWKGSILLRQRGLRLAADDPSIADQFRALQIITQQISARTRSLPEPDQVDGWKKQLAELGSRKEKLEQELMRTSAAFREATERITFERVRDSIAADGVLVDYLEYSGEKGPSLLASVIHRDREPVMIALGSATEASEAIDTWRRSFGSSPESKAAGVKLREQLWEPLVDSIGDAGLILVSSDGVLGRLPLVALPGSKPDSYLIEDHRIALIPVPQLLPALVSEQPTGKVTREMLLMGDVDYDAGPGAERGDEDATAQPKVRKRPWERDAVDDQLRGGVTWESLSATRAEVEFIAGLYHRVYRPPADAVLDLRKSQATETAFRTYAPECVYLHLATHGFFAAPEATSALSPQTIAKRGDGRALFGQQREVIRGRSPGQLSGIVFAGANRPPRIDPFSTSMQDDGIMTADEIAFLPLGSARLVVLSACETGLGEVAGGEGLLGIQRGFQVAGARSTIASLWKVNDAATRRLMEEFYTNHLDKEMSILDALRETQLWALNHPGDVPRGVIREKRDAIPHRLAPQFWAPFVLSGDWR